MKYDCARIITWTTLVSGLLLLQGCGMRGPGGTSEVTAIPEQEPVAVQPLDPITPEEPLAVVPSVPVLPEVPAVPATTPYTIKKGDTISAVAYRYNLRWQDVVAVNPGVNPNKLRVGQVIKLPGVIDLDAARRVPAVSAPKTAAPATAATVAGTQVYTVKSGDTLSEIALRHGVKTSELRELNSVKGDKILVGQKLKIPAGGKKVATSVKAPAAVRPVTKSAVVTPPVTAPPKIETTVTAPAAPPATIEVKEDVKVEAPVPDTATTDTTKYQTHVVGEKEDLYKIAIRWSVSPSDLKELNKLDSTIVKPGTVLKIPPSSLE